MTVSFSFVAAQTEHLIMVGQGGLTFNPSNISANPGDVIAFQFMAKNHSATQTTFAAPCNQLVNTSVTPNIVGISSGFMPVPANSSSFPQWRFAVTDATPLWFMCAQTGHCQQGMVFSVNANAQKTFDQYLTAAKASGNTTLAPQTNGQQTPPGSSGSASTPGAPAVISGSNGTPTAVGGVNGSPISGTTAAPTASKSAAALRGVTPAAGGVLVMSLVAVFGAAL